MRKQRFRGLFMRALREAASMTKIRLHRSVPDKFLIELHGPRTHGEIVSVDQAVDRLYLDNDRFYRIIDIAIIRVTPANTVAFVRVSGHSPGPFSETWDPDGLGPFKEILLQNVEDQRTAIS
jgi:hypothetical protein